MNIREQIEEREALLLSPMQLKAAMPSVIQKKLLIHLEQHFNEIGIALFTVNVLDD